MQNTFPQPERAWPGREVVSYLQRHRRELLALLETRETAGVAFARRHAKIMDGLVSSLFQAAAAAKGRPFSAVLGAVGGFGRGTVGWKSDLDVRVITDEAPEKAQEIAEALLYPLWDAGVSIGHQVSTVSHLIEAARHDLPTATSLLDFRMLAGDATLAQKLEERIFGGIFSEAELPAFFARLDAELSARHRRFGDSIYLLEPDVKSGAGGLRDLDIALWAARARFRTAGVLDMKQSGVLSSSEARELEQAEDFLWALRNHLHRRANRRSDRLTFEEQEAICPLMFGRSSSDRPQGAEIEPMVEAFMSEYYRHARVVLRLREQIMTRATPPVHRSRARVKDLEGGVQIFNDQITFTNVDDLENAPALVFRLYREAAQRELPLLPLARDVITRTTSSPAFCEALRQSTEAARLFVGLVANPRKVPFRNGSILAELHDVGLLTAMIPEFLPVVGRVHHDVYHVYTVDVHSVAAVDFLRALARGELAREHRLASSIAAEVTRPAVLYLATLLHDVGKAIGGRDHSRLGAEMAATILARLGFSSEDVDDACSLVMQHLVMYRVAARRDLEDSGIVLDFSKLVRGREGLRHLFLLTVADLSTTSPTSMTKWKRHMMDDLFRLTDRTLEQASPCDEARLAAVRAAVRGHWKSGEDHAFLDEYLGSMPDGYLLSNGSDAIAGHARVAYQARESIVTAAVVRSQRSDVAEVCVATGNRYEDPLCVIAGDRPGLLASIAAAITSNGFDVHAAQIHTRRLTDGRVQAVDLFWVTAQPRASEDVDGALGMLERDLERMISGKMAAADLLKGRRGGRFSDRPVPAVSTEVLVDNRVSGSHTMIEVATRDRPGLLFTLARTLQDQNLTIGVAKINTEGTRVLDVFYVTDLNGKKIDDPARAENVRVALISALDAAPPISSVMSTRA